MFGSCHMTSTSRALCSKGHVIIKVSNFLWQVKILYNNVTIKYNLNIIIKIIFNLKN